MKKLLLSMLLLVSSLGWATTATVTGTVTASGQAVAYGTIVATLYTSGLQGPFLSGGVAVPQTVTGTLNSSGAFSIVVTTNTSISPVGTQWVFVACTSWQQCGTYTVAITTGVSLSAQISATMPTLKVSPLYIPQAYVSSEVQGVTFGSTFYDMLNDCLSIYGIAGTWACISGSGGSSAFSAITSGTNSAAAMVIGTGGSLTVSGSGTNNATTLLTSTWASPPAIGTGTPAAATFTQVTTTGGGADAYTALADPACTTTLLDWFSSTTSGRKKYCDGASNIRTFMNTADAVVKAQTPLTTKGDLWVTDGSAMHRLGVGSDTQVLTADAASTDGVKWATASGGSGVAIFAVACVPAVPPTSGPFYFPALGGASVGSGACQLGTTEATVQVLLPAACTVGNFYVHSVAAQDASGSIVYKVRKNGVDTAIVVTVAGSGDCTTGNAYCHDTTHTAAFAAGDLIDVSLTNNASAYSSGGQLTTWSMTCQ